MKATKPIENPSTPINAKRIKFRLNPVAERVLFYFAHLNLWIGLLGVIDMILMTLMAGSLLAPSPTTALLVSIIPYITTVCLMSGVGSVLLLMASE